MLRIDHLEKRFCFSILSIKISVLQLFRVSVSVGESSYYSNAFILSMPAPFIHRSSGIMGSERGEGDCPFFCGFQLARELGPHEMCHGYLLPVKSS